MPIFRRHHGTHEAGSSGGAPGADSARAGAVRLEATVSGMVQGVGFRYWTLGEAERRGLVGSAGNLPDGTVHVVAEGAPEDIESFLAWLRSGETPGRVDGIEATTGPATGEFTEFSLF